jgi:hypothetical protein
LYAAWFFFLSPWIAGNFFSKSSNPPQKKIKWSAPYSSQPLINTSRDILSNTLNHLWIDKKLSKLIRKKNIQRKKLKKSQSSVDVEKYRLIWRETKQPLSRKRKDYNNKLTVLLRELQTLRHGLL